MDVPMDKLNSRIFGWPICKTPGVYEEFENSCRNAMGNFCLGWFMNTYDLGDYFNQKVFFGEVIIWAI